MGDIIKYRIYTADNKHAENITIKTVKTDDIETMLKIAMLYAFYDYDMSDNRIETIEADMSNLKIAITLPHCQVTVWAEKDEPFSEYYPTDSIIAAAKQLDIKTMYDNDDTDAFTEKCDDILRREK